MEQVDVATETTGYRSIWTELREVAFRQDFIEIDGVRTRYVEAGPRDAPGILMLHGTGGHWETFAANLGALSHRHRCIAIDMVGNGLSDKPDYPYEIDVYVRHALHVLDALGLDRATILGTSLGSWVAARFALIHPGRTAGLVLMSPAGLMATASNMDRIRKERTRAVENPDWDSIKAMFDNLIADDRNKIPDMIALRQAIYRRDDTRRAIDNVLALQQSGVRERNLITAEEWRSVAVPTLIIASGKDHNEYQGTAHTVAQLIPGAQLLEMPHVRHWPHFEDPATFNDAVTRFMKTIDVA